MKRPLVGIVIAGIVFSPCFLDASSPAVQQQISISGQVTDSKAVPIPAASVRVFSGSEILAETLTDLDGVFRFVDLPDGIYQISIEIVGFLKAAEDSVDISSNSSRNLAIQLTPLPRPDPPKAPSEPSRRQQEMQMPDFSSFQAADFQSAEVTDLPGLDQFQLDLGQEMGDLDPLASREDNFLFVSGNSASLAAGDWNDRDFRDQIMDAARQMGFQLQIVFVAQAKALVEKCPQHSASGSARYSTTDERRTT